MRSLPVKTITIDAMMKVFVVEPGSRFQAMFYDSFLYPFKQTITGHASEPRPDAIKKKVANEDFTHLFINLVGTDQISVQNLAMPENSTIAGKNDAPLFEGQLHDFDISKIVLIKAVKTEQAQASSKFAEVNIEDKGSRIRWWRA